MRHQKYTIFSVNSWFHHLSMWRVSVGRPSLTKAFRNNILIGWSWSNSSFGSFVPSKNRPKSRNVTNSHSPHPTKNRLIHKLLLDSHDSKTMTSPGMTSSGMTSSGMSHTVWRNDKIAGHLRVYKCCFRTWSFATERCGTNIWEMWLIEITIQD